MNEISEEKNLSIPRILRANTYFWRPGGSAANRRSNEANRLSEVARWCERLGLEVERKSGEVIATSEDGEIEVYFSYTESCKNVYRHFQVTRFGRRSNIIGLARWAWEVQNINLTK